MHETYQAPCRRKTFDRKQHVSGRDQAKRKIIPVQSGTLHVVEALQQCSNAFLRRIYVGAASLSEGTLKVQTCKPHLQWELLALQV